MQASSPSLGAPPPSGYRRREPERGVLFRVLSEHLATFRARLDADETRAGLPRHVQRELSSYLRCGILAHGFARVRCDDCGKDALVAFSCKGRGFCPSCGGRRMAQSAAHLVDHVLPEVPVRQWVLSMPWRLRYLLASDPTLCRAVRRSFLRVLFASYRSRAKRDGLDELTGRAEPSEAKRIRCGAVNVVQRFGSALNLNVHFHALVLDGVYTAATPWARPVFHPAPDLEDEDVADAVHAMRVRIVRLLRRRGLWPEPGEEDTSADRDPDSLLPFLAAASIQGRVALGPDAGRAVERLRQPPTDTPRFEPGSLCATLDGFSLHAHVQVEAHDRERLEHLCRYVMRPALATERLSLSPEGKVLYALRKPWRDGTTHFVFDPLTFIERLAALVPRPREHQLTYHGVLAPASSWRDMIVPSAAPAPPAPDAPTAGLADGIPLTPAEILDTALRPTTVVHSLTPAVPRPADPPVPCPRSSRTYSWSELMRRVFEIDVLACPHCGGRRRLVALITDLLVARRILEHLGLPNQAPALAAARPPPQATFEF